MSVLVPGATTGEQKALIAKLSMRLNETLADVDAKFAGRTFTAADVGDEISRLSSIVTKWYIIQYGDSFDVAARYFFTYDRDRLVGIADLIDKIGTIQDFMTATEQGYNTADGYPPSYVFTASDTQWQQLYQAERAPIEWLLGVAPPTLQNFSEWDAALTSAADDVANLPSNTIRYLLEQALKSLHLPTWLLPVMGVTVVVGLGTWAYFSFLAPISASSKVLRLRRNPGRRRRVRRRRRRS